MTLAACSPSWLLMPRDGSRGTPSLSTAAPSYDAAGDILTREANMPDTKESRNKALVLKAFDALFNKRDYSEAERYWSPGYIQHSAHIKPGREGLFGLVKALPPTRRYEPG